MIQIEKWVEIKPDDVAYAFLELWKQDSEKLKEAFNEAKDYDMKMADAIQDIFEDRFNDTESMTEFIVNQMDDDKIYDGVVDYFDLDEK